MPTVQQIHDLIRGYADGPRFLEVALAEVPLDEIRFTPGPEHWSIHENVLHLADTEIVAAARIRYLVAEPEATLVSFHGNRWARVLNYSSQSMGDALALIHATRKATTGLLFYLPMGAWEKTGANWKRIEADSAPDTLTLAQLVAQCVEHMQYHLRTIAKRRAQYEQAKS